MLPWDEGGALRRDDDEADEFGGDAVVDLRRRC